MWLLAEGLSRSVSPLCRKLLATDVRTCDGPGFQRQFCPGIGIMKSEPTHLQRLDRHPTGIRAPLTRRSSVGKTEPLVFSRLFSVQISLETRQNFQTKKDSSQRRSEEQDAGRNRFLGGSDPRLCGFSAARPCTRRGSLPPKLSSRVVDSVAG